MMSALKDINTLKIFANGGYWKAIDRPDKRDNPCSRVDKYGRGFNTDDRFSGLGTHKLFYASKYGFYGSSDTYTMLSIGNTDLFWGCFDDYLNQHQDEILNAVADLMQKELQTSIDVLKEERNRIAEIINLLEKGEQK